MLIRKLLDGIDQTAATGHLAGLVRRQGCAGRTGECAVIGKLVADRRALGLGAAPDQPSRFKKALWTS